jgi:GDP/UDP-N,N'-diacetylbacillosamine 2-epimerase (hydrolysing)
MSSVLRAIRDRGDLSLSLIVTGMHLLPDFGYTVREIERDGYTIAGRVPMDLTSENPSGMLQGLGRGIQDLSHAIGEVHPDIILVQGDRGESLAGALAGAYLGLPVAHVSGGDVTEGGMIDNSIRHCITKLAHLHFPGTSASAERIRCMGEDPGRIFMVGTPSLVSLRDIGQEEVDRVLAGLGIRPGVPFILVLQHPVTYESGFAAQQMRETMEAVAGLGVQVVVIFPNSDAGGREMIEVIRSYVERGNIRMTENLPYRDFLALLSASSVLVGNSSAGIVRTQALGVPCVNIGTRQKNREHTGNIVDTGYDRQEIASAVKKILRDPGFRDRILVMDTPYQDLGTGGRIAGILAGVDLGPGLLIKEFNPCR